MTTQQAPANERPAAANQRPQSVAGGEAPASTTDYQGFEPQAEMTTPATTSDDDRTDTVRKPVQNSGKPAEKRSSKGGAPVGNRNRTSHGIRGFVVTGSLPKGASYVRRVLAGFRLQLEKDVQEAHGTLSTAHIALIQSATRLEAKALLFQRWLKLEFDKISLSERLAILDRVTEATLARDKVLEKLGLMSKGPTASGASHDLPETLLAELEGAVPQGEGS